MSYKNANQSYHRKPIKLTYCYADPPYCGRTVDQAGKRMIFLQLLGLNLFVIAVKPVDLNSMLPPEDLLRESPYPFEYVLAFLQEPLEKSYRSTCYFVLKD